MTDRTGCPLAGNLFDDLRDEITGEGRSSGVAAETLELFVEQFSASILGERIVGIKRRSRGRLEEKLTTTRLDPFAEGVLAATIDCARELSSQSYAPIPGFFDEYLVPWLASVVLWLDSNAFECRCIEVARACLEALE